MKKLLITILLMCICSISYAKTKAERLKEKYTSDPQFHVTVDLLFDIANRCSKQDIDDAIYLLQQVDNAMLLLSDDGVLISP